MEVRKALSETFADLSDPRAGPAQRHVLTEMIPIALYSVLYGADSPVEVANESRIMRLG